MPAGREQHLIGLDHLAAVTTLLQRARRAHPTSGLFEAADLQWWWGQRPRRTDELPQLVWFDDLGRPEAAVVATDWLERTQLDPLVMPGASPDHVTHIVARGLAHASDLGLEALTLEVDRADDVLAAVLVDHGFAIAADGLVECWLAADDRPPISPLHEGYRVTTRAASADRPHQMTNAERGTPDPAARLAQTSLYRPDLDLVVHDDGGAVAAYGLFWFDPTTATGLVEPMRTEDAHQRRGLARHVLTTGIDLLAAAGAERIKICFEPDNQASGGLYLSVGFEPDRHTVVYAGHARAGVS